MNFFKNLFGKYSEKVFAPTQGVNNTVSFFKLKNFAFDRDSNRVSISKNGHIERIRISWIYNYTVEIEYEIGNDFIRCKKDWRHEDFLKLPLSINPTKTLTDGDTKNIIPGETGTLKKVESKLTILGPWIEYLLSHPIENVIIETIDSIETDLITYPISDNLAALMIVGNSAIKNRVGQKFWEVYKTSKYKENFLDVLCNRGFPIPAGFALKDIETAGKLLFKHCPPSEEQYGKQLILNYFGAAAEGIKPQRKVGDLVRYTQTKTKQSPWGIATYKFHTAKNLADARAFLDTIDITEDLLYYEVETPEGNVGKDKMGIY